MNGRFPVSSPNSLLFEIQKYFMSCLNKLLLNVPKTFLQSVRLLFRQMKSSIFIITYFHYISHDIYGKKAESFQNRVVTTPTMFVHAPNFDENVMHFVMSRVLA